MGELGRAARGRRGQGRPWCQLKAGPARSPSRQICHPHPGSPTPQPRRTPGELRGAGRDEGDCSCVQQGSNPLLVPLLPASQCRLRNVWLPWAARRGRGSPGGAASHPCGIAASTMPRRDGSTGRGSAPRSLCAAPARGWAHSAAMPAPGTCWGLDPWRPQHGLRSAASRSCPVRCDSDKSRGWRAGSRAGAVLHPCPPGAGTQLPSPRRGCQPCQTAATQPHAAAVSREMDLDLHPNAGACSARGQPGNPGIRDSAPAPPTPPLVGTVPGDTEAPHERPDEVCIVWELLAAQRARIYSTVSTAQPSDAAGKGSSSPGPPHSGHVTFPSSCGHGNAWQPWHTLTRARREPFVGHRDVGSDAPSGMTKMPTHPTDSTPLQAHLPEAKPPRRGALRAPGPASPSPGTAR